MQTVEQLLLNIFPSPIERGVFTYQLEAILQKKGRTWHWYGSGNNGKSTLIKAFERPSASVEVNTTPMGVSIIPVVGAIAEPEP